MVDFYRLIIITDGRSVSVTHGRVVANFQITHERWDGKYHESHQTVGRENDSSNNSVKLTLIRTVKRADFYLPPPLYHGRQCQILDGKRLASPKTHTHALIPARPVPTKNTSPIRPLIPAAQESTGHRFPTVASLPAANQAHPLPATAPHLPGQW